jgi:hypothetical protein
MKHALAISVFMLAESLFYKHLHLLVGGRLGCANRSLHSQASETRRHLAKAAGQVTASYRVVRTEASFSYMNALVESGCCHGWVDGIEG